MGCRIVTYGSPLKGSHQLGYGGRGVPVATLLTRCSAGCSWSQTLPVLRASCSRRLRIFDFDPGFRRLADRHTLGVGHSWSRWEPPAQLLQSARARRPTRRWGTEMTLPLPLRPCQQKLKACFLDHFLLGFAGGAFAIWRCPPAKVYCRSFHSQLFRRAPSAVV